MTTTAAITPLTDAQKRVAAHLVHGIGNHSIAALEHLSAETVKSHLANIRANLNHPPGSARTVIVDAVLTHRQIPPPPAPRPDADLDPAERKLLRAIATHSRTHDIALNAGIAPGDLRAKTAALMAKIGATNPEHLVGIGHALDLLGPALPQAPTGSRDGEETSR
ncbi:LuxR C-terminal-related transcriptional regulator [Streptomyces goshikiensis]